MISWLRPSSAEQGMPWTVLPGRCSNFSFLGTGWIAALPSVLDVQSSSTAYIASLLYGSFSEPASSNKTWTSVLRLSPLGRPLTHSAFWQLCARFANTDVKISSRRHAGNFTNSCHGHLAREQAVWSCCSRTIARTWQMMTMCSKKSV